MKLSGAQILIEELLMHDVTTAFGYPGGAVLPIYDELYKNSQRINHIITAHEQGGAHAADGYARVNRKTGVVIATSGPGATNLVTGIANAYLDSVPIVAITGNVAAPLLGKDSFQEVDIMGITQPVVKHNFVVREVEKLSDTLREAFCIANSGRKGPVLVDIPKNVQTDTCEYLRREPLPIQTKMFKGELSKVIDAIKSSEKPFIYAGGGVLASGAQDELLSLSKKISAPVGLSMMGLTALPASYELNLGMCGMHGKYAANVAQSECDLMIALGVRFSDRATGNIKEYKNEHTIIHVDIDMAEIDKNVTCHIEICCDIKEFLNMIIDRVDEKKNEHWLSTIEKLKEIDALPQKGDFTPQKIIKTVNKLCSKETVVATDVGQHQMWTMQHYKFESPNTLLTSGGLGTMGYGMGAAIGGCIAKSKQRTVLFTSDGSFGMNLNELATAVTQKLPIVIVLLNNGTLGMVRQWQNMFYDERYSQTTLNRKTDFVALAKAFGGEGYIAANLDELAKIFSNLSNDTPTLIECRVDMDEKVLPMIPPGGSVKDIIVRG